MGAPAASVSRGTRVRGKRVCAALPEPQRPESMECVRKRGKEYAERLAQWLKERPNGDSDPEMVIKSNEDFR